MKDFIAGGVCLFGGLVAREIAIANHYLWEMVGVVIVFILFYHNWRSLVNMKVDLFSLGAVMSFCLAWVLDSNKFIF